ncbi:MAG: hypothetical protein ACE5RJ_01585 [Nitrosopumilaceae archaeon]
MTRWLVANTVNVKGGKIEYDIPERPLLHCCSAEDPFGDVRLDIRPEVKPDVVHDVTEKLPFENDSFKACFADFPWINAWKWKSARAIREMLRVAPVVYTISPWLYGAKICHPDPIYISQRPGINVPILFVKYVRNEEKFWKEFKERTEEKI